MILPWRNSILGRTRPKRWCGISDCSLLIFNQTSGTPFFYFAWSFLDDLIAEDFTNLKMPDGNVEPLISPKLAVAMESPLLWNGQVASFILLYLFIQGRVSTTLLILVLCGALDFLLQRMKVPQEVYW